MADHLIRPLEAFTILSDYETKRYDYLVTRVGEDTVKRVVQLGLTDKLPSDYEEADREFSYASSGLFGRVDDYGLVAVNAASLLVHKSHTMDTSSLHVWLKASPLAGRIDLQKTHQFAQDIEHFRASVTPNQFDWEAMPKVFNQLKSVTRQIR